MSHNPEIGDCMTRCEIKRLFLVDGKKEYRWTEVKISDITGRPKARCSHCKGAVRLHFKKQIHGTEDLCEHMVHQDSVNCRAGHYFKGEHRESHAPVE